MHGINYFQWADTSRSRTLKGKKQGGQETSPTSDVPIRPSVLKHFSQKPKKHALAQVTMCYTAFLLFVPFYLHLVLAASFLK